MINNKSKTVLVIIIMIIITIATIASICVLKADINKLEIEKAACVDKLNRTTDKLTEVYEYNSDTKEAFEELITGETVTHDVVIWSSDGKMYTADKDTINGYIKSHYKRK